MKSLDILRVILLEAQSQLRASTSRDWETIQSRHKDEGDSFLGITLPAFNDWLVTSLSSGQAEPAIRSQFRKRAGSKSVLPCFLHGLTALVFDAKTGRVRSDMDSNAVFFIRQICLFHKKQFAICSPERDRKAIASYEEIDLGLRRATLPRGKAAWDVGFLSDLLSADLESAYSTLVADPLGAKPRHGPGATANKRWGNDKWRDRSFLRRWSGIFSWEELYGFSTVHQSEGEMVHPAAEQPAKVVSVPKSMKTSRIICVEPSYVQYAQQLVSTRLRDAFDEIGVGPQLNLRDQTVNQRLAHVGSLTGQWATLDLSEASDRLHCKVVRRIFRGARTVSAHLFACRTSRALLPDGRILPLMKYASMGSALTFPVEAYCFYVICAAAVLRCLLDEASSDLSDGKAKGISPFLTQREIRQVRSGAVRIRAGSTDLLTLARKAMSLVYVFGDDIIVPTYASKTVASYLQLYLLKVNALKSFDKGPFRESCGKDYVNGDLVTPVYCRYPAPEARTDAISFVSWVSMSNRFHESGLWMTAEYIRKGLDKIEVLPLVSPRCSGLGYTHYSGAYQPQFWRRKTTDWGVKTLVGSAGKTQDVLTGYDRLLANQVLAVECEDSDQLDLFPRTEGRNAFDESPRRNSLRLRRRVVTP